MHGFQLKYDHLPGDMPPSTASAYGLFTFTGGFAGTDSFGDGRGIINGYCGNEALVFWRHLSQANLVEGNYGNSGIATTTGSPSITTDDPSLFLPPAAVSGNYYIASGASFLLDDGVTTTAPKNSYFIFPVRSVQPGGCDTYAGSLSPIQVYTIDSKIDDGKPNIGTVRDAGNSWDATPSPGFCVYGGVDYYHSTVQYNIDPDNGRNDRGDCWFTIQFE